MPLRPLKQWICDECRQLIEQPTHGFLEWLTDDSQQAHGFRIVHQAQHSPHRPTADCYLYTDHPGRSDMHLETFLGDDGVPEMLWLLDAGPGNQTDEAGSDVRHVREWVEVFRRLHIPYYEEARLHWPDAREDDFFDGANDVWNYRPTTLKKIVKKYGNRP